MVLVQMEDLQEVVAFKNGGYITGASVRPNLNIGGRVSNGLDYLTGL
jgi:hypothetical protein